MDVSGGPKWDGGRWASRGAKVHRRTGARAHGRPSFWYRRIEPVDRPGERFSRRPGEFFTGALRLVRRHVQVLCVREDSSAGAPVGRGGTSISPPARASASSSLRLDVEVGGRAPQRADAQQPGHDSSSRAIENGRARSSDRCASVRVRGRRWLAAERDRLLEVRSGVATPSRAVSQSALVSPSGAMISIQGAIARHPCAPLALAPSRHFWHTRCIPVSATGSRPDARAGPPCSQMQVTVAPRMPGRSRARTRE